MQIKLKGYSDGLDSTGGLLFVNDDFFCFTCEDEYRAEKVYGETRIPRGKYQIKLRDAGGMNEKYKQRYSFHRGMLHLQNVPNFEWVYIHTGNTDDHTEGCILVGFGTDVDGGEITVSRSREAYEKLYNYILLAIDKGEEIEMEIT
jgi:hypothetical protein